MLIKTASEIKSFIDKRSSSHNSDNSFLNTTTGADEYISNDIFNYLNNKFLKECHICRSPKPPRAHHCKICNQCVLRMDHHCGWVANCIGRCNLKFFVNFNLYLAMLGIYSSILFLTQAMDCAIHGTSSKPSCNAAFEHPLVFNYIVVFATGIAMFMVALFCLCLLAY